MGRGGAPVSGGYYKRRRGILEHLEAGTISLLDLAVHDYLSLKANLVVGSASSIPPGVCITSAVAIHATCPSQISERAIQRSLEHLQEIGWIKRWTVRGKHGNYPVLVCRASVHDLSGNEYRINGAKTTDWRNPVCEPVGELSPLREIADKLLSTDREVRSNKTPPATKKPSPADPRFQPFYKGACKAFEKKYGRKPLWSGKDRKGLKNLLKEHSEEKLPAARLEALWRDFLASTEPFTVKQGGSLAYFCSNVDKFSNGPLLAASPAVTGKPWSKSPVPSAEEIRGKRSIITDQGKALLEKAGGFIQ